MTDTIYALSTLYGKSGIAVTRVSGPKAKELAVAMLQLDDISANHAYCRKIHNPSSGDVIDEGVSIFFKGPHSFTGEDTLELQTHGSIAVIKELLSVLANLGLRPAEPGEFSRRSFLNGKMDLTQAEGLSDLIEAETNLQRRVALAQLQGNNANLYEGWRRQIISVLANLEALVDFPEEDIPPSALAQCQEHIDSISSCIIKHLDDNRRGEILHSGFKIAIIGEPNVGKSSLINYLAGREIAIVSDIPGTTRDLLEVKIDLGGFPVIFQDTAGIRETADTIEAIGIDRALKALSCADLILHLDDKGNFQSNAIELNDPSKVIRIATKSDQAAAGTLECDLAISLLTNSGLDELIARIKQYIETSFSIGHSPVITHERYRYHLQNALNYFQNFAIPSTLDIRAEYVRLAANEIGRITGRIDLEEILDELFGKFCIGK